MIVILIIIIIITMIMKILNPQTKGINVSCSNLSGFCFYFFEILINYKKKYYLFICLFIYFRILMRHANNVRNHQYIRVNTLKSSKLFENTVRHANNVKKYQYNYIEEQVVHIHYEELVE